MAATLGAGAVQAVMYLPWRVTPDPLLCSRTMLRSISSVSGTPSMTLSPSQITPGKTNQLASVAMFARIRQNRANAAVSVHTVAVEDEALGAVK